MWGLLRDTLCSAIKFSRTVPLKALKMDSVTAIQWCEEENGCPESSVVVDPPGETWTEEQFSQAVKTLVPDKKVWVINVKLDRGASRTYALTEWKRGVPDSFRGAIIV